MLPGKKNRDFTVPSAQHWCLGGWCWSCAPGKHTAL